MTPPKILKCPECLLAGTRGYGRIGNRKSKCPTCNSFKRRVERATMRYIRETFPHMFQHVYEREQDRLYAELTEGLPKELFDPEAHGVGSLGSTPNEQVDRHE